MHSTINRRTFLKASGVVGGVALQNFVGAPVLWAGKPALPQSKTLSQEALKTRGIFNQAEELTSQYLGDIEQRLRVRLEKRDESLSDEFRMWCINLAMQPFMAGVASSSLEYLGDNKAARERLSPIMPLIYWMSEPFLFPLEPQSTPKAQAREMDKVFKLMARLRTQGFTTSLDNVGDASLSLADAKAYQEYYTSLLHAFIESDHVEELFLSLKLSALVHELDAALGEGQKAQAKRQEITDVLSGFLQKASQAPERNIFLRIDMEEYAYKDLTLQLFREIVENNPATALDASGNLRLGVVIQAYLRDAAKDVRMLADWARARNLRVPIRLVKGAYLDFERDVAAKEGRPSPVWDNKPSTDANYEAVSAYMLLNKDAVSSAFATHNIRSQAHAMALAKTYGLPPEAAPIQMLYGMGDPIKHVIASMNHPLREYIPAGSWARGLKYAGRRFAELASSDNALAKTMRGDFSDVSDGVPIFTGKQDKIDSEAVRTILQQALARG